jgi:hypothetical protein
MSIQGLYTISDGPAVSEETVNLDITDGTYTDTMSGKLNNRDMLRVLGKALFLRYTDFTVYLARTSVKVMELRNGELTVNWDVVRVASKEEWNA